MAISRFEHGSSTYNCKTCGKRTRNTGDEGNSNLCARCWEEAGDANSVNDGHTTEAEFVAKWGETVRQFEAK